MLSRTYTATTLGLEPIKIEVEVDGNRGTPALIIIGLATKAVDESKERITSALVNCGIRIRSKRTIVNLAPADIRKTSPVFELAIAIGMLKMYGEITVSTDDTIFLGELSLDGDLKPIRGALPLILAAKKMGFKKVVFPAVNIDEVTIVSGITLYPISHLMEYLEFARKKSQLTKLKPKRYKSISSSKFSLNFADIIGQQSVKRALEIAAAGAHNLVMVGPPGSGKSMMAKALVTILPPLSKKETIDVTTIYSICGLTNSGLINQRPFRSPHYTISSAALLGGGSNLRPGEISLAHRGVLFLDEMLEFARYSLEALRQPLEDGQITISRVSGTVTYPASFTLIAAANPCPCGWHGSSQNKCVCSQYSLYLYRKKLSGPILDRIDMFIRVKAVDVNKLTDFQFKSAEKSKVIRKRVTSARKIQTRRYKKISYLTNSEQTSKEVKKYCRLSASAQKLLGKAAVRLKISARSYFKTIKVAQTIADLEGESKVEEHHIAEALQYRRGS